MGDQHFPVLIVTVIRIVEGDLTRIVKTASGLFKSDTVLSHIGSGLISIPLESDQSNLIFAISSRLIFRRHGFSSVKGRCVILLVLCVQ